MTRPEAFWNMRAKNYDAQVGPHYEDAYRKTLENTVKYLHPDFRVLDFACGTGIVTLPMAASAREVLAIDIAPEMVARIREVRQASAESRRHSRQSGVPKACQTRAEGGLGQTQGQKAGQKRIKTIQRPVRSGWGVAFPSRRAYHGNCIEEVGP